VAAAPKKTRLAFLGERKEVIYENLRDLNFEFKAGKIAEADFEEMRTSLEAEAAELLAEIEMLEDAPTASGNGFPLKNAKPKGARP
jgi:outer membrane protein TolC